MYRMKKRMYFWNTEACKSILVEPENTVMNIENEHHGYSLGVPANISVTDT